MLCALCFGSVIAGVASQLVINEVTDKGNDNDVCQGEDYIELKYTGSSTVSLVGLVLIDDKEFGHEDQFVLGGIDCPQTLTSTSLYLLLCKEEGVFVYSSSGTSESFPSCASFIFGIGDGDTISLHQSTSDGTMLDTTGPLFDVGENLDDRDREDMEDYLEEVTSHSRIPDGVGDFEVSLRTPGNANEPLGPKLFYAQDDDGANFFDVVMASFVSC